MEKCFVNKTCRFLLLLSSVVFLYWYLPVAYHNVYVCDDFWFGTNVSKYGFLGNQIHYWFNWEGSYTHTFLDSLPHLFEFERMPFYFNLFSLGFFVYSIYYFIRTFFNSSKLDAFIIGFYICAVLYTFTNGNSEIRFWVSANAYIVELASVILALSLYHEKIIFNKSIGFLCFFLIVIAGCKLTFILYTIVGFILHDIFLKIKPSKSTYIVFTFLLVFSLLNVLAPGNIIRLQEETSVMRNEEFLFSDILMIRINKILPFLVYSLLLLPTSLCLYTSNKISKLQIFLLVSIILITFLLDSIIMYICFHDPGPLRIYILCEMMILLITLSIYTRIISLFTNSINKFVKVFICLMPIIFILYNIPMIKDKQLSREFAKKAKLRNEKVILTTSDNIKIEPLPESYLLLSYFVNDKEWLENVYLPYFGKSCTISIEKIDD